MDGTYGEYGWITGPNDATHVVWAIGDFFFSSGFLHTNYIFNMSYRCTEGLAGGYKEENGFGPLVSYYYYYLCLLYLLIIYLISIGIIEAIKLCRGYR